MLSRSRRPIAITALASTLVLTVAACGGGAAASEAPDTVRIVIIEEPPTLEPCDASLTSTGVVVRSNITEPLTERNPTTGDLEPLLSTSWTQTSPTTWTFTLRDGVTFSDGTPFDSAAAAFAIDRAVNGDLGCDVEGYVFGDTDLELATPDPLTLTVSTPEPDPILPLKLSFVEIVAPSTDPGSVVRQAVGTGPYTVGAWDVGTRLTLERNPTYWGEAPAFARAVYQWRDDPTVRAAMVVRGEADLATGLGPEDGADDLGVSFPNNETTALRIQVEATPLDDVRVRQAISLAVDRAGIVRALFNGDAVPAAQLVPDGVVGFNPGIEPEPFDPVRARQLIDEARADGVPVDTPIRFIVRSGLFPRVDQVAQAIAYQLVQAGLTTRIEMVDTAESNSYQQRPFPEGAGPYLLMIQHGNQSGDASNSVDQYLRSEGYQSSGGTAELDALIDAATQEAGEARQQALGELFVREPELVHQFAYIAHMRGILALSPRLDYEPNSATGDEMRIAEMSPTAGGQS